MSNFENFLLVLIMDKSGSMGEPASNDVECAGFTRNDFARQGGMLCVNACPESMYMACVAFDSTANVVSKTMQMSSTNKTNMCDNIKTIRPSGGTDIFSAMEETKRVINEAKDIYGIKNVYVIMFTDGEDSKLNETNVSSYFDSLKTNGEFNFSMDTVGFGPSANTQLLVKMAGLCNGTYALCFDASMVGTIFGRATARTYLGSEAFGIYENFQIKSSEYYNLKNTYHMFRTELSQLLLNPNYRMLAERVHAVNTFNTKMEDWLGSNNPKEITDPDWYGMICSLHADLNDQIRMAVSDANYWTKWGKAYWQTMGIALEKQYAPNYKDNSLQGFGSETAKKEYDRISKLYDEMSMIAPSNTYDIKNRTTAIPLTSAAFNDPYSGCFHPNSTLLLSNGNLISVSDLEVKLLAGEQVFVVSSTHGNVPIEAILKTNTSQQKTNFCKIGNTVLTPTHPILLNNRWFYPKSVANVYEEQVMFVFNIILGINPITKVRYTSLLVNDNECIALAHAIQNDPIATDCFWGSELLVDQLKSLYQTEYSKGVINFNHKFKRNKVTGWVDDIDLSDI
jgi:uncharacterized protein YegL